MKTAALVALFAVASARHPVSQEMIDTIREKTTSWRPAELHENPLAKLTVDELSSLHGLELIEAPMGFAKTPVDNTIPAKFDGRDKFGKCIHDIRNQKHCGSCWAFGASEVVSDKFCIASKGKIDHVLSPQDMVSCDDNNLACSGGNLFMAFGYLEDVGIVTDRCLPYVSGDGHVPACAKTCASSNVEFKKYKCKKDSTVVESTPEGIRSHLFNKGPMETGFMVFEDFYNYYDGVYKYVTGDFKGGHAVKMIGYGEENGERYYLCANSWGAQWAGLGGFFKIKEGECNVDGAVFSCDADLNTHFFA